MSRMLWSGGTAVFLLVGGAGAPGAGAQSLPPLEEHHVRAFEAADGLPAADVQGLVQGGDGYLYIGGGRGLVRFDGHNFARVELAGFASEIIAALYTDSRGRVWIVSAANDLGVLEDGRLQALRAPAPRLIRFTAAADGTVWFGTADGIVRVRTDTHPAITHFTSADGIPADTVDGIFELRDGAQIGVGRQQLFRIEDDAARAGGVRFVPFGPRYRAVEDIRIDADALWLAYRDEELRPFALRYRDGRLFTANASRPNGSLFAWTDEQIDQLPAGSGTHTHFPVSVGDTAHRAELLLRARDGTQWMSVPDALGRSKLVRRRGLRLDTIALNTYLDFRRIRKVIEDHEGSLWVGTDRGLLQVWSRKVFALTSRQGLAENFTAPVLQTRDSAVWIGTWGGGLHRFADGRLTHHYTTDDGLPRNDVRALYEAGDGTLWVGMLEGYAAIRDGRIVWSGTTNVEVRAAAETPDGKLWLGTANELLFRAPLSRDFIPHRPEFWRDKSIWALHTAQDGALWIGSERGLFRVRGDEVEAFDEADGLRGGFVVSIYEERDGTLWFGTYEHGLHRWRGGRFVPVTTREGLHHNGIWRMLEDGRGGVWMSSDQGQFRVEYARLHETADAVERGVRLGEPLQPLVFTETEGTPNRESNRASPGGWRLHDGRLVFNNLSGVVVIDPARAGALPPPPRTVLQRILTDGQPELLSRSQAVRVRPGTRQLVFEFAALSFISPNQNRYRYRVDGYDDRWVEGGVLRRATYTNLPPGRYSFRVQGASGRGQWSEPGVTYAFSVAPFVWQTWWFRLLAFGAFAALLVSAHRYRVRQLLEMEQMRVRIAADLHDDVGSNLSSIALLSEMLQTRERLDDDTEQRQLRRIQQAAAETVGALRDVIWIVDPKHGTLADLVVRMRNIATNMLHGTPFTLNVAGPEAARPLHMSFMRAVLLIYKEALHNIAAHARASDVRITITDNDGRFVISIEDDGTGFDPAAVRRGRGLDNMQRRALLADARLEIDSAPDRGTRITLSTTRDHSRGPRRS